MAVGRDVFLCVVQYYRSFSLCASSTPRVLLCSLVPEIIIIRYLHWLFQCLFPVLGPGPGTAMYRHFCENARRKCVCLTWTSSMDHNSVSRCCMWRRYLGRSSWPRAMEAAWPDNPTRLYRSFQTTDTPGNLNQCCEQRSNLNLNLKIKMTRSTFLVRLALYVLGRTAVPDRYGIWIDSRGSVRTDCIASKLTVQQESVCSVTCMSEWVSLRYQPQ
jgi:hypothetical protein